jgi:hypothetical protein
LVRSLKSGKRVGGLPDERSSMSADIVNLRQARKHKARAAKEQQAAENRVRHGRTKAEKETLRRESELERVRLDGHTLASVPPRDRDDA